MTLSIVSRHFEKEGKPFFYLADTCWSAFTNIHENDWLYYLQYRKRQGYNTLQINILPQWDASATDLSYHPWALREDGSYDFHSFNATYFQHARKMAQMAKAADFELALVVLWCNYVPQTWANKMVPQHTMPLECLEDYLTWVDQTFSDLDPIYVISGDTDLDAEIAQRYYLKASEVLACKAPHCLQTMHVRGRLVDIPEKLISRMDFYMFQSGHNAKPENAGMPYQMPEYFVSHYPIKPLINAEPCYEQMGYSGKMYGRHHVFDIRRAAWQSLLSGASAGITYGAAGIYSWHSAGMHFGEHVGEAFDTPQAWQFALHYPGAWDYSDIRHLFETYGWVELVSRQDLLLNPSPAIRLAITPEEKQMLIYVPECTTLRLKAEAAAYQRITIIDLETRHREVGTMTIQNDQCVIGMHIFRHDVLYLLEKE